MFARGTIVFMVVMGLFGAVFVEASAQAPAESKPETKPAEVKPDDKKPTDDKKPADPNKPDDKTKPAPTPKPKPKPEPSKTPGSKWAAHDMKRPRPEVVTPGALTGDAPIAPPSDATRLFDGADLKHWMSDKKGTDDTAKWKVENGYFEVTPKMGGITTRDKFGDCQIHIEWATPAEVKGQGQGRGNSGIDLSGNGEVQVLDSFENDTYPDGQAAALYGKYPPRVNASRKPGEWQTYDIIFESPKFDEKEKNKLLSPTRLTVLHNGVLVHHAADTGNRGKEITISLQDHGNPVRYRNIWVRPLKPYPE